MKLFETIKKMGHEQILFCHDEESDLKAIIAIHDTSLGSAMGATRLWPFASEEEALQDALRLSRGMTYKAACLNIPIGGGKGVIIANPENKTDKLLRVYGRFVQKLNGRFITGQDVNLSVEDVRTIGSETNYVVGVSEKGGGPAPVTARGVFLGIKAATEFCLRTQELDGLKVAVQGLGNVGKNLCHHLHENGVKLFVSDLNRENTEYIKHLYGATVVEPNEIYCLDVDVFAPCALGGVLNSATIPQIKAPIIAGAANNQLEDEQIDSMLLESKGILYCPDYVINAGGLINVYNEMIGYDEENAWRQLKNIYNTLMEIFIRAKQEELTTHEASKRLAHDHIIRAKKLRECVAK
ncbi:tryptophan dehydrogenase ScyB [Nostoc sp. FACHB-892]|uniref:tryptophan dehydrogenase ScyB n=1 Tax=Nostoc sp. FACHB-892 TaxID=2692843 RepID=UPI001687393D|nr:tryptophan dehydrogenase ScyB [Nostoc sp. FACHB-892]MBD2731743.1 tryptophan dehydrogenase ScyB [Nostoc sp. FACHB-892]